MSKPAFVLIILSLSPGSLAVEGVVLHDGKEIPGKVTGLVEAGVLLEGQAEPLPLHELSSVVFPAGPGGRRREDWIERGPHGFVS